MRAQLRHRRVLAGAIHGRVQHHRELADVLSEFARRPALLAAGPHRCVHGPHAGDLGGRFLEAPDAARVEIQVGARRQLGVHVELALDEFGDEFRAERGEGVERAGEEPDGQGSDAEGVFQRSVQRRRIRADDAVVDEPEEPARQPQDALDNEIDAPDGSEDHPQDSPADGGHDLAEELAGPGAERRLFGRRDRPELPRGEHRDQGERDEERDRERERDGEGLISEQLSGDALDEDDRNEHADRGHGARDHRLADLAGAGLRGLDEAHPLLPFSLDRLEHHDGVVHQEPDPEGDAAQRHDVQRDARHVHQEEGPGRAAPRVPRPATAPRRPP